jgi:hypothetical protein
MFCGPSRLVWFAFGSVATWAYIRHHHHHHHQGAACPPPRVGYGYNPGHGHRAQWEERERDQSPPNNNVSSSPPGGRGDYGQWRPPTQPTTPMDIDRERLRQIGRSAEETVSAR